MLGLIILQIVLIALNAIFACAEIAVLSINETKLERMAEQGNRRAKRLFRLTREPARFLATIQVAITLSGFLGSAFAADNFSEPLVDWIVSLGVTLPRATLTPAALSVSRRWNQSLPPRSSRQNPLPRLSPSRKRPGYQSREILSISMAMYSIPRPTVPQPRLQTRDRPGLTKLCRAQSTPIR